MRMRRRFGARLFLGQTDLRQFGIGIHHPRNMHGAHIGLQPEQRVLDHDAGVIVGEVGELLTADGIADGVDFPVGRLELLVDLDAAIGVRDAGAIRDSAASDWAGAPSQRGCANP